MQSPEQIPILAASVVITIIALTVIIRSWLKTRNFPAILYTVTIVCFSGMVLDLLLDQTYMPFRQAMIEINGQVLWISNVLLAIFIVGGYLAWYFAIIVSEYETPPKRSMLAVFLAGGSLVGALLKSGWSELFVLILQVIAFGILIAEIIRYGIVVLRSRISPIERRPIQIYFIGFVTWIIAGPIGIIGGSIPGLGSIGRTLWVFPYGIGLLIVVYAVAKNPLMLTISETLAYDYLILDKDGVLILAKRVTPRPNAIDLELLGSAMSGVISLMREMIGSGEDLNGVNHGNVRILVEHGLMTTHLLVASQETPAFRQILRNLVVEFETNYREQLLDDSSTVVTFEPFGKRIEKALTLLL